MATSQGILASAAASATYNMALQLLFRLGTFILNAFVLRHVSRDLLGVVNVRLMLLYTTTLFVAREAFRRACMSKSTDRRWPQVINLLWLTVPLGVMCAVAFGLIWIYVLEAPDARLIPHYQKAVVIFALCTLIELLAEPLWVIGQVLLFVRLRVIIEGIALASRCLFTVGFVLAFPKWGLWTFCIAQVMHSVIYTSLYYAYFAYYMWSGKATDDFPFKSMRDFLPRAQPGKELINPGLASLTWSFFKQSSLKQLLTEGERYVMTVFSILSFADQGLYDVINNLGSLAARFIFLPIEDAAYLLFSHTLDRGIPVKEQSKDNLELSSVVLDCLLKFVILVGLTILVFGIAYAELALDLYGGTILSSGTGPMLLRWYCFYVLVIALNGVTESFVFASMSKQQVDKYNQKLLVFSFVFLTSSLVLTRYLGSVGFILANCLNMGSRIVHSLYYIHQYYKDTTEKPLQGMIPYKPVIAALSSSFLLTFCSMRLFCCSRGVVYRMAHVAIGGICFFLVIIIIYFTEQPLINFIRDQWRKRYSQQTEQREIETTTQQKIKGSKDD